VRPAPPPAPCAARGSAAARLGGAYCAYFLSVGLTVPYFAVFLRWRGYDLSAIGWMLALAPAMRVLVPPSLGFLADRSRGAGFWGAVAAWSAVAGIAGVVFGPSPWVVLLGLALYSAATAPAIPLLDATLLREAREQGAPMGRIRLWGSVGFLLTSCGLGFAFPGMPAAAIGWGLAGATVLFAVYLSVSRLDEEPPVPPQLEDVGVLLRGPGVLLLLGAVFLNRAASSPYNGFYTLFVQDLGLGGDVVALNWALAVTTECVAMLFMDRAVLRFGAPAVFAFGCALEAARWFAHAFVTTRAELLMLSPFHGLAFCALFLGGARCFAHLVPARLRATGQGLNAAASGLGATVGYVAGGRIYEAFGGAAAFAAAGVVGVACTLGALQLARGGPMRGSESA